MASDFEEFFDHFNLPNYDYTFREADPMIDSKDLSRISKMTKEVLGKFLHK